MLFKEKARLASFFPFFFFSLKVTFGVSMHKMRVLVVTFAETVHVMSWCSVPLCISHHRNAHPQARMLLSSLRFSAAEGGGWDGNVLQVKDQLEDATLKAEEQPHNNV